VKDYLFVNENPLFYIESRHPKIIALTLHYVKTYSNMIYCVKIDLILYLDLL